MEHEGRGGLSREKITHRMVEAFRAAMLRNGIGAGAEALGISQPAMSRIIADFQRALGFQLFTKHGRSVQPTEEAMALMLKVQQSFLGLEDIVSYSEQLRTQKLGRLSIVAIPSIGLTVMPSVIKSLRQAFPDVIVSLRVVSYLDVAKSVRNRQADIGLTADALSLGMLETVGEFPTDCVCIGTEKWLDPNAGVVNAEDLAGKPFIASCGTFQTKLFAWLRANGVEVDIMIEASLFDSLSELSLQGLGVSIVDPMTAAKHRRHGGVALPLKPALGYTVYATALHDTKLTAPIQALLCLLSQAMRET